MDTKISTTTIQKKPMLDEKSKLALQSIKGMEWLFPQEVKQMNRIRKDMKYINLLDEKTKQDVLKEMETKDDKPLLQRYQIEEKTKESRPKRKHYNNFSKTHDFGNMQNRLQLILSGELKPKRKKGAKPSFPKKIPI